MTPVTLPTLPIDTSLNPVQEVYIPKPTGKGAGGEPEPIAAGTVSIDNYAAAFVNIDGNHNLYAAAKPPYPGVGASIMVNVTVTANDAYGVALPPQIQPIQIKGAPPPPPAVQIVMAPSVINRGAFDPQDPGTSSVNF